MLVWGKAETSREKGEKGRARAGCVYGSPQGSAPFLIPAASEWGTWSPSSNHDWSRGNICQANQRMTALLIDSGTKKLFPSVHEQRAMSDQENLTPIGDPQRSLRLRKTAGEETKLGPR